VTQDDLLYRFRRRTFAMAAELGNVRAACRAMGIHPSTYSRWKQQLDRYGPEILRPRERRPPRMANQTSRAGRAAGGRLRPGPSRLRPGPDRHRTGQAQVGCHPAVGQRGVAGAAPPRPQHPGQALWAGRRLRRPTSPRAASAATSAAPGRRPPRPAGPARSRPRSSASASATPTSRSPSTPTATSSRAWTSRRQRPSPGSSSKAQTPLPRARAAAMLPILLPKRATPPTPERR
jgi:Helix-turn-helix domain